MKKVIFAIVGALALTSVVSSCNKKEEEGPKGDKLATPKNISVKEITSESVTLTWDAVNGAERYAYIVDAAEAGELKGEATTNEATIKVATDVTHTFALKATAAGKTDSDFAQFTIPAKKEPFTATIKVVEITSSSALVTVTPGSDDSYVCTCVPDSIFSQLSEEDILSNIVSNVTEDVLCQGEQSFNCPGLTPETKYQVLVIGFDSNIEAISDLIKEDFTTGAWTGPSDEIKEWLGTYEFTYEKALRAYIGSEGGKEYVYFEIKDTTITKQVQIEECVGQENAALIYGISNLDDDEGSLPAIAFLGENNELLPFTGFQVADADGGYAPTWLAICYCDKPKDYYFVTGQYAAYSMANGEGTPYSGQLEDQSTFTVTSFGIFAVGEQISFYDFPKGVTEVFYPAEKFTYTKTGDVPAPAISRKFFQMGENLKPLNIKNFSGIKAIEK